MATTSSSTAASMPALKRFELRGFERVSTLADKGSYKVAHVMVVHNQIDEFLRHLPAALVHTFNKHPRMRATQVRGSFATAEVQPPIVLDDLVKGRLLGIRGTNVDEERLGKWQKHVEEESNLPFDRFTQLPFFLRVWVNKPSATARLLLFSDKFVSDTVSGTAVLHDLLAFASALSLASPSLAKDSTELPLRPSLYHMWLDNLYSSSWTRFWVKWFASSSFKTELKTFTPLLPVRADQKDMTIPVQCNHTSVLFAEGGSENLRKLQAACDREGVKLQSALEVAVLLGYYALQPPVKHAQPTKATTGATQPDSELEPDAVAAKTTKATKNRTKSQRFKLRVETQIDMRRRVDYPVPEVQVGDYTTSYPIASFATTGVAIDASTFWDLARANKRDMDALLQSYALPKPLIFADQSLHERTPLPFFEQTPIPHSTTADVTLANVGSYIYARSHDFRAVDPKTKQPTATAKLTVESVFCSSTAPHLASSAALFVSSVSALSFGLAHKYNDKTGRKLLQTLVAIIEHLGNVQANELASDVVAHVLAQQKEAASVAKQQTQTQQLNGAAAKA